MGICFSPAYAAASGSGRTTSRLADRRALGFGLAKPHDQLAPQNVSRLFVDEAVALENFGQARARVVCYVLVLVTAGLKQPVERFDRAPSDGVVVGRAD